MNEELNKKLAEWAGFKNLRTRDTLSQPIEIGSPWLWGQAKDGTFIPLDFTQSLDACFKWLVPKLRITVSRKELLDVLYDWYTAIGYFRGDESSALALCKAIEKLIDGEK